ncbi:hypothetical protein TRFO_15732 [Tritrichomonas foetus]|uniref:MIF4G domain-containing protein n=1 Tax=Tritrichomonas foetus TaxID=1144522 RepID=A0A1J4KRS5_9EUKA|nr:hypothetical protein TRFO_15732 [Tritrichomonas foetus]|eukprot:OHT13963.1 hypothetical protein TRFO_15732 [Tritrichomonas foetus]
MSTFPKQIFISSSSDTRPNINLQQPSNNVPDNAPSHFPTVNNTTSKPIVQIQIKNKDGTSFQLSKNNASTHVAKESTQSPNNQPAPPPQPQQPAIIKVERPTNVKKTEITKTLERYSIEELLELDCFEKIIPRKSRGFIALQNYLKEMESGNTTTNYNNYNKNKSQSQGKVATYVEVAETSYQPTIFRKNINEFDYNSDEAYQMNVNQMFNRLTSTQIDQVIEELMPKLNSSDRLRYAIDTFVSKASQEKNFAKVYAEFVTKLHSANKNQDFVNGVLAQARDNFGDCILNPGDENSEADSELCCGQATFLASLVKNGLVNDGTSSLNKLFENLKTEDVHPHYIEMLFNFVKAAGPEFVRNESKETWEKLTKLVQRQDIRNRLHFLLLDIQEIVENWLNGKDIKSDELKKNPETSKSLVRNGFASFLENDKDIPNEVVSLRSQDFFSGSMLCFPDIDDAYDFSYYQCFVLKKQKGFNKGDIIDILNKSIDSYIEQSLDSDCPHLWENFSTLLCQLMINSMISLEDARAIHANIKTSPEWDPLNDLKYFIHDNHDFSEAIEIQNNALPLEICEALKMPITINNKKLTNLRMSRIVAVAVVRSAFYQFRKQNCPQNGMQNWKVPLSNAFKKQEKAFREAVDDEISVGDINFTTNDLINLISQ